MGTDEDGEDRCGDEWGEMTGVGRVGIAPGAPEAFQDWYGENHPLPFLLPFPFLSSPLPLLSLPLSSPPLPLPLEVGPLIAARGSGGAL